MPPKKKTAPSKSTVAKEPSNEKDSNEWSASEDEFIATKTTAALSKDTTATLAKSKKDEKPKRARKISKPSFNSGDFVEDSEEIKKAIEAIE